MNFKEIDSSMRENECSRDGSIPLSAYIIARLDGRGFSTLTNQHFEKPYDLRFHRMMSETVRHLMQSGIKVPFAYTQSDEISLLLLPYGDAHGRKARKLLSLLAAEASARFSLQLGEVATFDCRLNLQYEWDKVQDYFRWRSIDAERNSFNAYCYWLLRGEGVDARSATEKLRQMDVSAWRRMLLDRGVDFAHLPRWQVRGTCFYWRIVQKEGFNPHSGEPTLYTRRILVENEDLEAGLRTLAVECVHPCQNRLGSEGESEHDVK